MRLSKILLAGLALIASATAQSTWKDCGSSNLVPTSVTLISDPPVRGVDEKINFQGTLSGETATGGGINLSISFAGFTVYNNTFPVCSVVTCPVAPGPLTAILTVPGSSIPPISPSGDYTALATITDQNSAQISCVAVTFHLP